MPSFDELFAQQEQLIGSIGRSLANFKKLGQAKMTLGVTRQRLKILNSNFDKCQVLNGQLIALADKSIRSSHAYFTADQFNECEAAFLEASDYMAEVLERLQPDPSTSLDISTMESSHHQSSHLPKMSLPTFDGKLDKWENFRDRFDAMIIKDKSLCDVERLHYLNSCLSDSAKSAISHLAVTSSNFAVAWKILVNRFENKRQLITAHLTTLNSLPQLTSENVNELRELRDRAIAAIESLKNLDRKVDMWDDVLVFLLSQKLDKSTRRAWELDLGDKSDYPTFNELDQFLIARIRALESISTIDRNVVKSSDILKKKSKISVNHSARSVKWSCPQCQGSHSIYKCDQFLNKTPVNRYEFIKKINRCINCLSPKHSVKDCESKHSCQTCQKKHNSLLHFFDKNIKVRTEELPQSTNQAAENSSRHAAESQISSHFSVSAISSDVTTLLATARVRVYSPCGRFVTIRALIDQGSACSMISERIVQLLRLSRINQNTQLTGVGEASSTIKYSARVVVTPAFSDSPGFSTHALILRSLTKYIPNRKIDISKFVYLSGLNLADSSPLDSDPIELIIGAELFAAILVNGFRKGKLNEPIAQNTAFGWIISGPVLNVDSERVRYVTSHHADRSIEFDLRQFWEVEDLPAKPVLSHEEEKCENHFKSTHSRNNDGRYIVRYPFTSGHPVNIGKSNLCALANFKRLEARLCLDPIKYDLYRDFMSDYIKLGHMIKDSSNVINESQHYYIPHHPVFRDDSETSRLRVVFNASALTSNGTSLNDHLMIGPKLQIDIMDIILRWRQFRFVFTADIAKMYRQILIDERDHNFQRIFWRHEKSKPIEEYKLLTVTYGTASAPFQALRVLQQLALDEGPSFPLAVPVLKQQIYVDDCLFGADCEYTAIKIRDQLIDLLNKGGFRLRKWSSNTVSLIKDINPEDHGLAQDFNLNSAESLKVLGLSWNPSKDSFHFRVSNMNQCGITKRHILSTIARFFDPLGWVSPVLIFAKILIQKLWKLKLDWDAPIPSDLLTQWQVFFENLHSLNSISIPRWTNFGSGTSSCELHGFSDASSVAYAAVVYMKITLMDGTSKVSILLSKTKVAPIKTISLPRLELCAAVILAKLVNKVHEAQLCENLSVYCWSDSTIALAWIKQPANKWKVFVANRVAEIQTLVPYAKWRHIPTNDNPADCASRGISADELMNHPLWWSGPSWLVKPEEHWPSNLSVEPGSQTPEERVTLFTSLDKAGSWNISDRFSSWPRLLRVTAYIFRFLNKLKPTVINEVKETSNAKLSINSGPILTSVEIHRSEVFWLRHIQLDNFFNEYHCLLKNRPLQNRSSLLPLNPYLDKDGLIRVGGRLRKASLPNPVKNPVILRSHYVLNLIIKHYHEKLLHAGPLLTLTAIREKYWILRAKSTVRSVLYHCVICTRQRATSPTELMGDLPSIRVNRVPRAFTHTGVDYAGPIALRYAPGRGSKAHKAYIAVFICMTVKAIHLELVHDCSASSFIAAFHRFVSRRGIPSSVYSDNGTNFQGASKEVAESFKLAIKNSNFRNELSTSGLDWHFIPPASPHFGGLWEAAVRSVKFHLKRSIGLHTLTFMEMSTLLCRIEACLNSRPLAPASDNLDDYQVITPGHFLIGTSITSLPEPSVLELNENRLSRWQLVQKLSEEIWRRWSNDYLHSLQQRPKWRVVRRLVRPGRIVLIRNPSLPPSHWELGRIIDCHPGDDGLTRVVTVKTARSVFKRPVVKLCFLPIEINHETSDDSATAGGTADSHDSIN